MGLGTVWVHEMVRKRFSVTQIKSGSWRAMIRRKDMKPVNQTFPSEKLAIAWAKEKVRQLDEVRATGKMTAPRGATVADYIDDYLTFMEGRQLQRSALFVYASLKRRFGSVGIHNLSPSHMESFINERKAEKVQGQTIASDLSLLSSVLRYCKEVKNLDINSEMADEARKGLKTKHKMRNKSKEIECIPTEEELNLIYKYYEQNLRVQIPMVPIIKFALASAMRQEEICSILIEDINFEARTVKIRDRKDPKEKMGNDEIVPLLDDAMKIVKEQIGDRKYGRIFPYNSRSVCASYTRARPPAGVKRRTRFHDLRHKAVTDLFAQGLSVPQVALMSGHKDWKTLKRYTHVKASHVHLAMDKTNRVDIELALLKQIQALTEQLASMSPKVA